MHWGKGVMQPCGLAGLTVSTSRSHHKLSNNCLYHNFTHEVLTSLFHLLFAKVWNWIQVWRASHWHWATVQTLCSVWTFIWHYTLHEVIVADWGNCEFNAKLLYTHIHTPLYPQWPNKRYAKRQRERDRLKEKDTKKESPGGSLVRLMSPLPISWWYIYFFSAFQQSPVTFKYIKSSESDKS